MTIEDIWTETFIEDFTDNDLRNFEEIVLRDVKNKSFQAADKEILLNNKDLWLFSLQGLRREIELQLAQHKTNLKTKRHELRSNPDSEMQMEIVTLADETWRNNALKFLVSIERKTLYVKLLIQQEKDKD